MTNTMHISLTDELQSFVNANCGEGTSYATPGDFICDLIRQRKNESDAAQIRESIRAGYDDAIAGRTLEFRGNLRNLLSRKK